MSVRSQRLSFPIPEAIDGARWSVDSVGPPRVDLRDRAMFVPLDESNESRFLRAHENAHAAITPRVDAHAAAKRAGASMEALQVCEDLRVHWFLRRVGVPTPGAVSDMDAAKFARAIRGDARRIGAALVGTFGTGDYDRLREAIGREIAAPDSIGPATMGLVDRYVSIVNAVMRRKAKSGRARCNAETPRGFARATIPAARMFDKLFGAPGAPGAIDRDRGKTGRPDAMDEFMDQLGKSEDGRWGTLDSVAAVPMEAPRAARRSGRARAWRDEGACPVALHRWATDGRIFAARRRAPGGTVLVDVSGSMSLSSDDLARIVAAAPGATVAMYAGRRDSGGIRIVARRGRVASEESLFKAMRQLGGGNIIDGPALRWLADQPEPRVWVSDGAVSGCNDTFALNLFADAASVAARGGIRRVDGSEQALEALTAKSARR